MDEVMGRVPLIMAAMARAAGACPDGALARLPFDEKELKRRRVRWSAFVDFMEHLAVACGGPAGMKRAAELQYPKVAYDFIPVLGLVVSPRDFCRFMHRAGFPRAYGGVVEARDEDHPGGWLHIHLEIAAAHKGCLPFFQATEGALCGIPRLFGQERAEVVADLSPRKGFYRVCLPPAKTLTARVRRFASRRRLDLILEDVESSWVELGHHIDNAQRAQPETADDGFDRHLQRALTHWKLTSRQALVVAELVRGWSNKEISAHLGCALHTVELHVSDILRRTGYPSRGTLIAAFWASEVPGQRPGPV
jgi:DNA-binding CsgD family transcriptional regulator